MVFGRFRVRGCLKYLACRIIEARMRQQSRRGRPSIGDMNSWCSSRNNRDAGDECKIGIVMNVVKDSSNDN